MHLLLAVICLSCFCIGTAFAQTQRADSVSVEIVRGLSKDLFDLNSIPFLDPLVISMNATSNSRFFQSAHVPKENSFYIRFGVETMVGFVREDQKTYEPQLPTEELSIGRLQELGIFDNNITDTAAAALYLLRTSFQDGLEKDSIIIPEQSATIFGNETADLDMPKMFLSNRIDALDFIDADAREAMKSTINNLPDNITLPEGQDFSIVVFAVPQVEIGSFWSTELLLRYIPKVKWSETIGKFGFWGVGLKHNISNYVFPDIFQLAVQGAFQSTSIENTIGVTEAELTSDAEIWNANIHASKQIGNLTFFSGFSVEKIDIDAEYVFTLPIEIQLSLGLVKKDPDNPDRLVADPPEYPGDTQPQTSNISLSDTNLKWTGGVAYQIGPVSVFADYSVSEFNILSGGLTVGF